MLTVSMSSIIRFRQAACGFEAEYVSHFQKPFAYLFRDGHPRDVAGSHAFWWEEIKQYFLLSLKFT